MLSVKMEKWKNKVIVMLQESNAGLIDQKSSKYPKVKKTPKMSGTFGVKCSKKQNVILFQPKV